ncbi:MAG: DsbA family protein [Alphaproteobacteria bacterium]|nr:DsbA family protein [Alphaproteobacteria bacterium]
MLSFKSILSALLIGLMPVLAFAADAPATFTDSQKTAIEDVVRNLLIKKEPDIIIKAAQEVQGRQEAEAGVKNKQALTANKDKLYNDPNSPIGGNPKGDVVLVEFFDYQCGYCKLTQEGVHKLLAGDKNVKLVYKEFPILGPDSVKASKAALASVKQGKYIKFHEAMMSTKEHLTEEIIFKVAASAGLNVEKLKKDMEGEDIDKMIKANQTLGSEIGAHGTPTFVIGEEIFPGAVPYENLKKAVDDARKDAKK